MVATPTPTSSPMPRPRTRWVTWAGLLLALALGACGNPAFKLIDLTGADYARGFNLPDANGQPRALQDYAGRVVVVFFGYVQCPDVCPTTLTEWQQVRQALGADGARVQVVFVTVDPARDTPEVLRAYMANFDPSFVALVPSAEALRQVASEYKVYYRQVPGPTPTSYTMEHSAGAYVYDPNGQLRLYARYGASVEALTHDVRLLLNGH